MSNSENDNIKSLISRHLTGEISGQEEQQLRDWISANEENGKTFEKLKKVFELSLKAKNYNQPSIDLDVDHEWSVFLQRISSRNEEEKVVPMTSTNRWGTLLKAAAGLALLFGITFAINYYISNTRDIRIETANKTEVVTLPDGSVVTLNKNSILTYSPRFGGEQRSLSLSGEAFFEVVPDIEKPFIIHLCSAEVRVVGTTFNVNAYRDQQEIEVVVETGKVKFSANNSELDLTAGARGIYHKANNTLNKEVNPDPNFNAWKTRKIVFERARLQSIVQTLNSVYGNKLILASGNFETCQVTVTFDNQSLEAVLNVLKNTLGLTLSAQGDQIKIVAAECQ